ncbi:MAG: DUF1028 domain-containing protein [Pseudomonadota bacterium]
MTYSILGADIAAGEIGIAVQSKFPGVGSLVPHAAADAGAIATQAFANPAHGRTGLALLGAGASPDEALSIVLRSDEERDKRQLALIDRTGSTASYTGEEVRRWPGWAGAASGHACSAQGNGLASGDVASAMVTGFEAAKGDLASRLLSALAAGEAAGGELRGQQSAALLIVKADGGYGAHTDRHVDISVYDHLAPIDELARCLALHRLSYFPSDPENLIAITGPLATELKTLLSVKGFFEGPADESWDKPAITALARFMGWENYDNRIRDDALIDTEVLDDIRKKYGTLSE